MPLVLLVDFGLTTTAGTHSPISDGSDTAQATVQFISYASETTSRTQQIVIPLVIKDATFGLYIDGPWQSVLLFLPGPFANKWHEAAAAQILYDVLSLLLGDFAEFLLVERLNSYKSCSISF